MKIIALLPFKNEEKMLPSFLSRVLPAVDQIIAVDDNSTDNSVNIMNEASHKYNVPIDIHSTQKRDDWGVDSIRQELLLKGREAGGTHFVCLDADETFTGQFPSKCRAICEKLEPGQKLQMQWLAMWKSVDHYRDDNSVWSNNYKDFVFCDDEKLNFGKAYLCEPRTPGPNNEETLLKLNPKYGAVIHFQFSGWESFQIKQAWYRCRELLRGDKHPDAINQKYRITLDDPNAIVRAMPDVWKNGVVFPQISYEEEKNKKNWRLKQIKNWFKEYGVKYFKDLEIWHISELKEIK